MTPARIFLIRHGETAWTLSGQHTGVTDIPLTENGRAAAAELRGVLTRIDFGLVLTSPLRRARETCELAGFAGRCEADRDLVEWNYGEYEGLTSAQIQANAPGWMLFEDGCPGGETAGEVASRTDRVIARLRGLEMDVVLFAHGHVLRAFVARWLGLAVSAGSHFLLDPATVSVVSDYHGAPAVKRWNAPLLDGPGGWRELCGDR
jgi:probable phosphoglycerate mutase